MDAFEQVVAELFWAKGYWVRTSVHVDLTKPEKASLGPQFRSIPRPEIDVLAYQPERNHLLALECKSFLDSRGVTYAEVSGGSENTRYKMFTRAPLRKLVLAQLAAQCEKVGLCKPGVTVQLGMVAAKIKGADEGKLVELFKRENWVFHGPAWVREQLSQQANTQYTNQVSTVVAKILLRK